MLEARTRLSAQLLRVQTATHAGSGGRQGCWRVGLGSERSRSTFKPQAMRALEGGKGVGGSDSARCAVALRSNHNPCGRWREARVLEARTRHGAQLLHVQTTTHAGAGGEARGLEDRTRLGAQPIHVQTTTHACAGGEARVLEARTDLENAHKALT